MIHWAGIEGKQSLIVDALFEAYFVKARDIGDHDVLTELAEEAGLDAAAIRRLLEGDSDVETIQSRDAHSRKMGVTSVPTFIVANQHAVPGAQQPELWKQVIADIQQQLANAESD